MSLPFTISDLRQRPEFFDTVSDRIWRAWWQADGHPLEYISTRLRDDMNDAPIPFALVAHDGEMFLGTASVIASDLEERPQLTPWVAAVWVEPQARQHGVGGALVDRHKKLLRAGRQPRLSVRATAAFEFLPKPRLGCDRAECRAAQPERFHA